MRPGTKSRWLVVLGTALFASSLFAPTAGFASDLVFGPETCQRGTGAPTVFSYDFSVSEPSRGYIFKVDNGGLEDTAYELVNSSTVTLNGVEILGPSNFSRTVAYLEVPVTLQAQNSLSVEVRGKPGGTMIIRIFPILAIDTPVSGQEFPDISASVAGHLYSETTGVNVNGVSGTVTGTAFAVSGIPLVEGVNVLTATAVRTDGFTGQASVTVIRDTTPPAITLTSPSDGATVSVPRVDVAGSVDDPSAVVFVNGSEVALAGTSFATPGVALQVGRNAISIAASDPLGNSSTMVFHVTYTPPMPSVTLSVSPETIIEGTSATLSWTAADAAACSIDSGVGAVGLAGSSNVSPPATTIYTISCSGAGGTATASTLVNVRYLPPTASLTATPASVLQGASSTLTWTSAHAQTCAIDNGIGAVPCNGSMPVTPVAATTYVLTATGPGGSATATATTVVTVLPLGLQASLSIARASIAIGETTTLSWETNAATDVIIEPGVGRVAVSGSIAIAPTSTTRYVLTAVGATGVADAAALVSVRGTPAPLPEGSFGLVYSDLIPGDATLVAYDARRFSVVTGLVEDRAGQALSGVGVTVLGRPELGTAITDAAGRYSLPIEGGGLLTLTFRKEGLLTSQRQVRIDWNEVAAADTVVMIAADAAATTIAPDGDPSHAFVHRGSEVTTESGTRAATVVLTGDTRVYAQTEAGDVEIRSFELRATEFDSPEAMPAHLPPSSAFTYCVDLSASGLEKVRFSRPVTVYVDNFLGFDVGSNVPAGSYDYRTAIWTPSGDGKVVRLLDLDGDGAVDALDASGDGLADDLDGDGSFADEVVGLGDATRYFAGATLWRVSISHLTPWDFNWAWSFGANDIPPNGKGDPQTLEKSACDSCVEAGSYAEIQGRVLHEDLPIPGTGLSLHYASDRTEGHQTVIVVPASGDTVPATLRQIIVKLRIAGREMETTLPPAPQQTATFSWDGKDHLGHRMQGTVPALVMVGFTYEPVYYASQEAWGASFARSGGNGTTTAIRTRRLITSWRNTAILVHRDTTIGEIGNGWTLSGHHRFSAADPTVVYKGDGSVLKQGTQVLSRLEDVHNGELIGFDNYCANWRTDTYCLPNGLTSDAAGNLYLVDSSRSCIRKVDRNGTVTTIAGRLAYDGYSGDGGPATAALLRYPTAIALDPAGNLYISDTGNRRVRKVDTRGVITTVAGNGTCYGVAENIPAVQAAYCGDRVAADAWGSIFLSDAVNRVVRRVRPDGIVENVVQYPAIYEPTAVAADGQGNLYIADRMLVVHKYSAAGKLSTFAGTWGSPWYNNHGGDGGPATSATLDRPTNLYVDKVGNVYIAGNFYVRKVDTDGVISTVLGTGAQYGGPGSGLPATTMSINGPAGMTMTGDGSLFVVSSGYNAIYKVSLPGATEAATGNGDLQYADQNGLGYIFTQSGRHKATVDLDTGVTLTNFTYGSAGLDSVSDRFGGTVRIERNGTGLPTAIVAPDGQVTELELDAAGNLQRVVYPDRTSRTMAYDAGGLMTDAWDARGNHSRHDFDQWGRVLDTFDAGGGHHAWTTALDAAGNIFTSLQTPEGDVMFYAEQKDSSTGYTSTRTAPDGSVSTYFQAADKLTERGTPPWGGSLTNSYTTDSRTKARWLKESILKTPAALTLRRTFGRSYLDADADGVMDTVTKTATVNGRQWQSVDAIHTGTIAATTPAGRVTTLTYRPESLLTERIQVAGLLPTDFTHDARGRLQSVTVGERTTSLAYDLNGNPDYLVTPNGETYDYTYDLMGRLSSEVRPDGTTVVYEYDENGNLSVLTNPNLQVYGFGYNANNQRLGMNQPLSGTVLYQYDKQRRLISVSLPSGRIIQNTYQEGNLVATGSAEGTSSYSYASGGRLAGASRNGEGLSLAYDGPLVTGDIRSGSLTNSITYTYNSDLAVSAMSYAGAATSCGYDADGLLISAGGLTITRNAQNGLPEGVSGQGLTQTRSFSGYGELDGSASYVSSAQAYAWIVPLRDNAGRILQRQEVVGGDTVSWEYSYNSAGRLIEVQKDGLVVESYTYDANGNRLTETNIPRGIEGQSCSYSFEDHVIGRGADGYVFDVDGFLQSRTTSEGATYYEYSARGELLRVDKPDGTIFRYVHDPLGRRIAKLMNGTTVEKYLWAGQTTLLAVYDGSDNLLQRYTYADSRMPLSMTAGGATYFLLTDQVGSLRAVADTSGNIVKRIDYDSFGNIITDSDPGFSVPFGFAGGLHDRDTGLVRFGHRDYSPELGRFTAKDPIDFAGGDTNLYAYVMNDPVNFADPLGLYNFDVHFILTFELARRANFSVADSLTIARANQNVDDNIFSSPFNPLGGTQLHFASWDYAIRGLMDAGEKKDLKLFGYFLHIFQDTYSHERYRWIFGHIFALKSPDNFSSACARDSHMRDASLYLLQEFKESMQRSR